MITMVPKLAIYCIYIAHVFMNGDNKCYACYKKDGNM